ncbi:MAG: PilZ domain-containing protein [Sedimentisphaerales bacterium]|nr:PilZ domain-containing protein [Sedimentisphaerales bacterium]
MNEVMILRDAETTKVLQTAIDKRIPAVMSYLCGGKWCLVRIQLAELELDRLDVKVSRQRKSNATHLEVGQPVGIAFKYGYGYDEFLFDTVVLGLEAASELTYGGTITLAVPEQIEQVPRNSFLRVKAPKSLRIAVQMRHHYYSDDSEKIKSFPSSLNWRGRLIDISAEGLEVLVSAAREKDFKKGQSISLRLIPMPCETPLMFNAEVRNITPKPQDGSICLGLEMVGLEASPEGRLVLSRIVGIVEQYYQMNQSEDDLQDVPQINL